MNFPEPFVRYLAQATFTDGAAAWAQLDGRGRVEGCGGALHLFGPAGLTAGERAGDALTYMEALLPLDDDEPLVLPRIATSAGVTVDVHLFPDGEGGYGLLLRDVSSAVRRETELYQRANELALVRRGAGILGEELRDLFRAVGVLVAEMDDSERLLPLGALPEWAGVFVPLMDDPYGDWGDDPDLAFLGAFLGEARAYWERTEFGSIKSGLWATADPDGSECMYEATAAVTRGRRMLLLERDSCALSEKRLLIQKGRDLALDHQALARERAKLQEARDALEKNVRLRTRELEDTNRRLTGALRRRAELESERAAIIEQVEQAQRVEALGTLAGGIAHDFNNVLAAIIGYADVGSAPGTPEAEVKEAFDGVLEAAERAQELVRQILSMSREAETERYLLEWREVVEEVVKLMRATLPATVELHADLRTAALVRGNATELHQVVMNLCTNAAQAMRRSGGVLQVVLKEAELREAELVAHPQLAPGRYAVLEVRDTGVGISDELRSRVFEPFFTTKPPGDGTGIGLSVVYGIVSAAKGTVTVESRVGEGSTFRVFWPLQVGEPDGPEPETVRPVEGNECVLFVDDEPMQVELARRMLGRLGYRVTARADSRLALEEFRNNPHAFDVLITDLTMPGLTGDVLAREAATLRPDMPVIVISGHVEAETEATLLDAGVTRYLLKPARWRRIAEVIREVLGDR